MRGVKEGLSNSCVADDQRTVAGNALRLKTTGGTLADDFALYINNDKVAFLKYCLEETTRQKYREPTGRFLRALEIFANFKRFKQSEKERKKGQISLLERGGKR